MTDVNETDLHASLLAVRSFDEQRRLDGELYRLLRQPWADADRPLLDAKALIESGACLPFVVRNILNGTKRWEGDELGDAPVDGIVALRRCEALGFVWRAHAASGFTERVRIEAKNTIAGEDKIETWRLALIDDDFRFYHEHQMQALEYAADRGVCALHVEDGPGYSHEWDVVHARCAFDGARASRSPSQCLDAFVSAPDLRCRMRSWSGVSNYNFHGLELGQSAPTEDDCRWWDEQWVPFRRRVTVKLFLNALCSHQRYDHAADDGAAICEYCRVDPQDQTPERRAAARSALLAAFKHGHDKAVASSHLTLAFSDDQCIAGARKLARLSEVGGGQRGTKFEGMLCSWDIEWPEKSHVDPSVRSRTENLFAEHVYRRHLYH